MATLDTPLAGLIGKVAKTIETKLGAITVGDLLGHYPRAYYNRGVLTDISELVVGEHATLYAEVTNAQVMRTGRKSRVVVTIGNRQQSVQIIFWNQPWRIGQLKTGTVGLFSGVVTRFNKTLQLNSPEIEIFATGSTDSTKGADVIDIDKWVGRMMPVYPAKTGLTSWTIRRSIELVLEHLDPIEDPLPADLCRRLNIVDLDTALRQKHLPADEESIRQANNRLKFQEALAIQLVMAQRRFETTMWTAVPRKPRQGGVLEQFDLQLPFELTPSQGDVGATLARELATAHPMHRLLQGDVGSGKTLVALRGMLQVVDAGAQAALLAPTEVLAHQHARSIRALLGRLGTAGELDSLPGAVKIVVLSAGLTAAKRKEALLEIQSGAADIVVGTHALLEPTVHFAELGFVVVDEQHRFGVEQRDVLRRKSADGSRPHTLVMTATPIPRTVAMTVFGDLETSVMTDLPPGRSPITTTIVPAYERPEWLDRAWQRIVEEVQAGRQAYVVCPRIGLDDDKVGDSDNTAEDADEKRRPLSVLDVAEGLSRGALRDVRLEILHGRLPPEAKDAIMRRFARGDIDVLVSTTVIEVGVDVPNATVMVIMDAERFGISQLHQLRGRIGRGAAAGLCLLVTDLPESAKPFERLQRVAETTDGFALARADLELRREGDVLGAAQSGKRSQLRLLSLLRDEDVIGKAREVATDLISTDPTLEAHPVLKAELESMARDEATSYLEKG